MLLGISRQSTTNITNNSVNVILCNRKVHTKPVQDINGFHINHNIKVSIMYIEIKSCLHGKIT